MAMPTVETESAQAKTRVPRPHHDPQPSPRATSPRMFSTLDSLRRTRSLKHALLAHLIAVRPLTTLNVMHLIVTGLSRKAPASVSSRPLVTPITL